MYYPPAIQEYVPSSSRTDNTSMAGKDSMVNAPTSFDKAAKEVEHPGVTEKEKNDNQGVVPDAVKPPVVTQDPHANKEASKKMEIILATLPLPAKVDPASKGPKASEAVSTQPIHGPPKDNIVIKKK